MEFDINVSRLTQYETFDVPFYCLPRKQRFTYVQAYVSFSLPFVIEFAPDVKHLNWLKAVWGSQNTRETKAPYHPVSDDADFDPMEIDPIPF